MKYPEWANRPTSSQVERRRKRLTFLFRKAALRVDESAHITALSLRAGLDRSALHQSIQRLRMTAATRQKLSAILTEEEIRAIDAEMSAPNE